MTSVSENRPELRAPAKTGSFLGPIPGWLGIAAVVLIYGVFLWTRWYPATTESDDNGYYGQATLMMNSHTTVFAPESNAEWIGMHWLWEPTRGYFVSRYPPGYPLLIGVIYSLVNYKAAMAINPILSLLGLVGFYALARRFVSAGWAIAGAIVLCTIPEFVHHSLGGYAHMCVLCFLMWGLFFAMLWQEKGKLWQIFLMGLLLGCIPTIRYADTVMGLGAFLFLLCHWRRWPQTPWKVWGHYLVGAAGAMIPLIPMLIRNQLALGAPWRTGYNLTNEDEAFTWEYFKAHAIDYVHQINANGVGYLCAIGLAGMVMMMFTRKQWRAGLMLFLQTIMMILVYMAYYWAPQNNVNSTMRFLVPTFPLFVLGAVWTLSQLTRNINVFGRVAVGAAILSVHLLWGTNQLWDESEQMSYQQKVLATITDRLDKYVPVGSVIVGGADGAGGGGGGGSGIDQYLDYVKKWKVADYTLLAGGGNGAGGGGGGGRGGGGGGGRGGFGGGGDPTAPSPRQAGKPVVRYPIVAGHNAGDDFVTDIRNWAGTHKIYFVGTDAEYTSLQAAKASDEKFTTIAVFSLPEAPTAGRTAGRNPRGGGGGGRGGGGFGGPGGGFGGPGGGGGGGIAGIINNVLGGGNNARTEMIIAEWTFTSPMPKKLDLQIKVKESKETKVAKAAP